MFTQHIPLKVSFFFQRSKRFLGFFFLRVEGFEDDVFWKILQKVGSRDTSSSRLVVLQALSGKVNVERLCGVYGSD